MWNHNLKAVFLGPTTHTNDDKFELFHSFSLL